MTDRPANQPNIQPTDQPTEQLTDLWTDLVIGKLNLQQVLYDESIDKFKLQKTSS